MPTHRWRCIICGYVHVGGEAPYACPICNAPRKMFECLDCAEDAPQEGEKLP